MAFGRRAGAITPITPDAHVVMIVHRAAYSLTVYDSIRACDVMEQNNKPLLKCMYLHQCSIQKQ